MYICKMKIQTVEENEGCVYLGVGYGAQSLLLEFLNSLLVISQIQLGAHQDDGCVWTVVAHFRIPLLILYGGGQ